MTGGEGKREPTRCRPSESARIVQFVSQLLPRAGREVTEGGL